MISLPNVGAVNEATGFTHLHWDLHSETPPDLEIHPLQTLLRHLCKPPFLVSNLRQQFLYVRRQAIYGYLATIVRSIYRHH